MSAAVRSPLQGFVCGSGPRSFCRGPLSPTLGRESASTRPGADDGAPVALTDPTWAYPALAPPPSGTGRTRRSGVTPVGSPSSFTEHTPAGGCRWFPSSRQPSAVAGRLNLNGDGGVCPRRAACAPGRTDASGSRAASARDPCYPPCPCPPRSGCRSPGVRRIVSAFIVRSAPGTQEGQT